MEPPVHHLERAQQLHQLDDCMAQAHTLHNEYVAHVRRLRALHEQYLALRDVGMSKVQRRAEVCRIVATELDVLSGGSVHPRCGARAPETTIMRTCTLARIPHI